MPTEPKSEIIRTYTAGKVHTLPSGITVEILWVKGNRVRIRHTLADGSEIVADVPLTEDEPCSR
jgi:hypothetical protein